MKIYDPEPDVKVHIKAGCKLCGRKDKHSHTQSAWRALIDREGK